MVCLLKIIDYLIKKFPCSGNNCWLRFLDISVATSIVLIRTNLSDLTQKSSMIGFFIFEEIIRSFPGIEGNRSVVFHIVESDESFPRITGPQSYDITHRSELHRVTELSVLEEDIVQPVGVLDPLQGVQHHHKDSLGSYIFREEGFLQFNCPQSFSNFSPFVWTVHSHYGLGVE